MTAGSKSGFSLIELMVALAVLSIAGMALLNAVQQSTRTTAILESRSLARIAADNILNERLARSGALTEEDGHYEIAHRTYDWSLSIEPTTDEALARVVVTVNDEADGREAARLVTFTRRQ
ncbi:MAG: type II secretion system protein GspI [Maricaulis sp.]|jgi:general secretion pathway protein I|nr:type II secretion system protein GspI [Maricaulis sp.]MAL11735.1 type II secretion system protein GspI [Maricaulis sp.]HAQ36098.1 type II secretion system protein GspI [Alphaproteobacteria bacterium]|tara:strand:- start:1457 stop:1819 length:363 start_codon:yes stop_codon:yes gene_type:complete